MSVQPAASDESRSIGSLNSESKQEPFEQLDIPLNDAGGSKIDTKKPMSMQSLVSMTPEEKSMQDSGLSIEESVASSVWTEEFLDESERSGFSMSDKFLHSQSMVSPKKKSKDGQVLPNRDMVQASPSKKNSVGSASLNDSGVWEEMSVSSGGGDDPQVLLSQSGSVIEYVSDSEEEQMEDDDVGEAMAPIVEVDEEDESDTDRVDDDSSRRKRILNRSVPPSPKNSPSSRRKRLVREAGTGSATEDPSNLGGSSSNRSPRAGTKHYTLRLASPAISPSSISDHGDVTQPQSPSPINEKPRAFLNLQSPEALSGQSQRNGLTDNFSHPQQERAQTLQVPQLSLTTDSASKPVTASKAGRAPDALKETFLDRHWEKTKQLHANEGVELIDHALSTQDLLKDVEAMEEIRFDKFDRNRPTIAEAQPEYIAVETAPKRAHDDLKTKKRNKKSSNHRKKRRRRKIVANYDREFHVGACMCYVLLIGGAITACLVFLL